MDTAEVTRLLAALKAGEPGAMDRLVPLLYDELLGMARGRLRQEAQGHTLDTHGLVHEAYLRLLEMNRIDWMDRGHFLAVASTIMRRVLVDHARRKQAAKRGGGAQRVDLSNPLGFTDERAEAMCRLDDCLVRMALAHPRPAQAIEQVYFGGLSNEDAARALGVSLATLERDLRFGRAWLAREWSPKVDG
ncbi:MAG TPA: sigma-70 family RNA polymerase sigma factor [Planctomycetota bacterium]|nr:sigma-70 family RNA polymerase sigma factor [Planctomycetota bacterium]